MTVYVDDMRSRVGRLICCHMLADTLEELHAMAAAIGLPRRYFDRDHYDPCLKMRARAIALGAVEITKRRAVEIRRRLRSAGELTSRRAVADRGACRRTSDRAGRRPSREPEQAAPAAAVCHLSRSPQ